jgi:hypothetical protein
VAIGLCAAGVAACRANEPSLTLVFVALPRTAAGLTVHLSADGGAARFAGADAAASGVSVGYQDDGSVVVAIDRDAAAAHGDRIRLPLTAPSALTLDGAAQATADGGALLRAASTTAIGPGHDATLTFDFGAAGDAGAGPDAPPRSDGAGGDITLPPPDAGGDVMPDVMPDLPTPADHPPRPDAGVDTIPDGAPSADRPTPPDAAPDAGPPDAAPDSGSIPTHCVASTQRAASVSGASGVPALAYSAGARLYGVAWAGRSGDGLYFNAVDATGALQNTAADVAIVAPGGGLVLSNPRLAALGGDLVVAYGQRDTAGHSRATVARVDPGTGAMRAGPASGSSATAADPPEIGGVAVSGAGTSLAVVSRGAGSAATAGRLDLFSPSLGFVTSSAPAALATTVASAIDWTSAAALPDRYLAGAVVDATAAGGTVTAFGAGDLALGAGAPFTGASDAPSTGAAGEGVSLAAMDGGRVAVAWTDAQRCAGCSGREIFVTVVDLGNGAGRPAGEVQASMSSTTLKSFPHIVFDGQALAVAWLEFLDSQHSQVMFRRFDPALMPLGPILPVGPLSGAAPQSGDIGLVSAGLGEYGVVMWLFLGTQAFTHVICVGS